MLVYTENHVKQDCDNVVSNARRS